MELLNRFDRGIEIITSACLALQVSFLGTNLCRYLAIIKWGI